MTTIRQADLSDLGRVEDCARKFYGSSRFLKRFKLEAFVATWTTIFTQRCGVIFLLCEPHGEIVGALGAVTGFDPHSGDKSASEFFWFVDPTHRGRGVELYRHFEQWARDCDCVEIRMAHMLDLMPERLEKVYRRWGFVPTEVHYLKELT